MLAFRKPIIQFSSIPESWLVRKLKYSVTTTNGFAFSSDDYVEDGVSLIRISDVLPNGAVDEGNAKKLPFEYSEKFKEYVVSKKDILVAMTGATIGKSGIYNSNKKSLLNQRVCKLVAKYLNQNFLWYVLNSDLYLKHIDITSFGGAQPNISDKELLDFLSLQPPLENQQKIADFLDFKTAQIDALIAKKEVLLLKLHEKRSALITQAITKGINPNLPMKPSGVEWLGDVPEHWHIKRLKFAVDLINQKVGAESSDLDYIGLEHIESWTGRRIQDENAFSDGAVSHFRNGDVLFGKLRPYLAKVYLANHSGLVSTEALVLRATKEVYSGFLRYYMVARDFINIVNSSTFGSKMPRASWDFIGNLPILLPDYDEQVLIANFIDSKMITIDTQKKKIEDVISKLVEYRSSLITNAVTGKIDVRDFDLNKTNT